MSPSPKCPVSQTLENDVSFPSLCRFLGHPPTLRILLVYFVLEGGTPVTSLFVSHHSLLCTQETQDFVLGPFCKNLST